MGTEMSNSMVWSRSFRQVSIAERRVRGAEW